MVSMVSLAVATAVLLAAGAQSVRRPRPPSSPFPGLTSPVCWRCSASNCSTLKRWLISLSAEDEASKPYPIAVLIVLATCCHARRPPLCLRLCSGRVAECAVPRQHDVLHASRSVWQHHVGPGLAAIVYLPALRNWQRAKPGVHLPLAELADMLQRGERAK